MEIRPIAIYHGPLGSKFGIPRQSGVVTALRGRIVLEPPFRQMEALRGLDGFDRLWLIWGFSANVSPGPTEVRLTVRPPRLGGNERVGVFASRSPFRPNPLGLSCVRMERVEQTPSEGPVIHVLGADLMDGTPIYDIKPYIPYADAFPDARSGFASGAPEAVLEVVEDALWRSPFGPEETETLKALIALDPRPAYQEDPDRIYGFPFGGWDVSFKVVGRTAILLSCNAFRTDPL